MKSDIILWQQAATAFGESLLSHNGKQIKSTDEQYTELLDQVIVCDFSPYRQLYKDEDLQIYVDHEKNYLILSNYIETDESSRQIAYIAKIHVESKIEIVPLLQQESLSIGKHITHKTQKTLQYVLYAKEIIIACIILTIIMIIMIILTIK